MMVVFTDVDGTLIDFRTYEPGPALPGIAALRENGIPLVMVSSKTGAELVMWQEKLRIHEPLIPENGGAVMLPEGYREWEPGWPLENGFRVKRLVPGLEAFHGCVAEMNSRGLGITPITSIPAREIARLTGLPEEQARLAREREFSLPFILEKGNLEEVEKVAGEMGFRVVQGRRFHHLVASDKGRAVGELLGLYRSGEGETRSAGIGDNVNDLPMLEAVDMPFLVMREESVWDERVNVRGLVRAQGVGPRGFAWAVEKILKEVTT
jgi:mannosyl-3-phosphoglycerate phosphatase